MSDPRHNARMIVLRKLFSRVFPGIEPEENTGTPHNRLKEEALIALVTLGFAKNAAEKGIVKILKTADKDITLEEIIKKALKTA